MAGRNERRYIIGVRVVVTGSRRGRLDPYDDFHALKYWRPHDRRAKWANAAVRRRRRAMTASIPGGAFAPARVARDTPSAARSLTERLFPLEPTPDIEIGTMALPPLIRPAADLSVLDISEFFGETSGGIRTYLLEKARYVEAHRELRQIMLVPGGEDVITQSDGVRTYRLKGPNVPGQKPYRFMLATRSTRRVTQHEKPDVIEVGSWLLVPWLMRSATRIVDTPLVYFYHSNFPRVISPFPATDGRVKRMVSRIAWKYSRKLDKLFSVTIAASDFSATELRNAGIDRIARVPLGVDLDFFHPSRRERRAETRLRAGLTNGPLAIFVGRFSKEKELDVLVDAWAEVERTTDVTLAIIGDGPMRPLLEARAKGRRRVLFLPYQSNRDALADLVAAADFFVAPCSHETFGLSALEALSSGVPVLSADRGGVSEQVRNSGAGALFESGNPASLAEAVRTLVQRDLPALGRKGREYAEREHSWAHVFDRIFAVYRDVIGAR
jgi:alpha-1,6-mannosyltransferase